MDFKLELNNRVTMIENIIKERLINDKSDLRQNEIFKAMNYSVLAGGKRLRPMLLLETGRLFDGKDEDMYDFMTAIELVHTYSLVHDDLPAMDNDEYRRGRKTTHIVFGEDIAILAGDALLNYAFEIGLAGVVKCSNTITASKALKVLADKAGVYGMIGGQVVDVMSENKVLDKDTLDYIDELKTGALIEASMMMGAILAGANDEEVDDVMKIASKIGRAFQIQDDILDVTSTREVLGKPVLSDEKNNKSTYVNLLGIDKASDEVKRLSDAALMGIDRFGRKNEFLSQLIVSLIYRSK